MIARIISVLITSRMKPVQQYFTPTDTLDIVMKSLGEMNIDKPPVIQDENNTHLLGTVAKDDVIDAHNKEC